jgi:hypothetical protein
LEGLIDGIMPQGLDRFVKSQSQGQINGAAFPAPVDLARRQAIAKDVRLKPTSESKKPAPFQSATDHRSAHPYVQQSRAYERNDGGLFDGSVLSESDDTTRDLGPVNMRGYQSVESFQDVRDFQVINGVSYDDGYDEDGEGSDRITNLGDIEDDPDNDVQAAGFQNPSGNVGKPTSENVQEKARQALADVHHINSRRTLNSLPPIPPIISGRFISATNPTDNIGRNRTNLDGMTIARHKSRPHRNDEVFSDEQGSSDNDDHLRQGGFQRGGPEYVIQFDQVPRNDAITGHNLNGRQEAGDVFNGSELGSHFDASGQSSPSQHTPRGNGESNKQTWTSSQRSKRKNTDLKLDYEVDELFTMQYSELKDQPFDSNPKPVQSVIPENLRDLEGSLEDRLEHFRGQEPAHQVALFTQMPIDQWDQSGDWFLGRFGDIMSRLKDARRAKRDVSKDFEAELADREKAVRGKSEGIQEVLRQMRAGGEGVLRGRAS